MNAVIEQVDLEKIIDKIDVNAILTRVDLNLLLANIDVNALVEQIDMDRLLDSVDLNAVLARVDLDALIQQTEVGSIIAPTGAGLARDAIDVARSQGVGLDYIVQRWTDRLLRRRQVRARERPRCRFTKRHPPSRDPAGRARTRRRTPGPLRGD